MMDYSSPGDGSNFLSFKKGDLICLEADDGYSVMHSGWCFGKCDRTGEEGDFPANCVYVLPAIRRPPKEVLALFQDQSADGSEAVLSALDAGREDGEGGGDDTKYSLEEVGPLYPTIPSCPNTYTHMHTHTHTHTHFRSHNLHTSTVDTYMNVFFPVRIIAHLPVSLTRPYRIVLMVPPHSLRWTTSAHHRRSR